MSIEIDILYPLPALAAALQQDKFVRITVRNPSKAQLLMLQERVSYTLFLDVFDSMYDVAALAARARRVHVVVGANACYSVSRQLLELDLDQLIVESHYPTYNEDARPYMMRAEHFAAEFLEIIEGPAYPAACVKIDERICFSPQLKVLQLKSVQTSLKSLGSLLYCVALNTLALPWIEDPWKSVAEFLFSVLNENRSIAYIETYFGTVKRSERCDLGLPVDLLTLQPRGIAVAVQSPSAKLVSSEELSELDTSPPEFSVEILFFSREQPNEIELHSYISPREEVFNIYREVALAGFMVVERKLGLCSLKMAQEGAKLLITKCSAESNDGIASFLGDLEVEPDERIFFDDIAEYTMGNAANPISHNIFGIYTKNSQYYEFQLTVNPVALWIEEQDLFVAVVELLRFYYGHEVLYSNIIRKYSRKRVAD